MARAFDINSPLRLFSREVRAAGKSGAAHFEKFLASDAFMRRWKTIPPCHIRKAVLVMIEVEAKVTAREGLPPPAKPQRRCVPRWNDPAERQRLVLAYAQAKGDHYKAARIMGMTVGAVKLAKQRHIDAHATADVARAA